MQEWPPKTLEDIDKEIILLVKAINLLGVPTYSSCAGHVNGTGLLSLGWCSKNQYDMFDYSHSIENLDTKQKEYLQSYLNKSLERFYIVLDKFNEKNKENRWVLDDTTYSHLKPQQPCKNETELNREREKPLMLANLLFNEFRKEYATFRALKPDLI